MESFPPTPGSDRIGALAAITALIQHFRRELADPLSPEEIQSLGGIPSPPPKAWWERVYIRPLENPSADDPPYRTRIRALARHLAPRRYVSVTGYADLAIWAVAILQAYGELADPHPTTSEADRMGMYATLGLAWTLTQHDVPTFYVGRSLLESLYQTEPPQDVQTAELRWPHPGMIFMLPWDLIRFEASSPDHEVRILGVAASRIDIPDGSVAMFLCILLRQPNGTLWPYTQMIPLTGSLATVMHTAQGADRPAEAKSVFAAGIDLFWRVFLLLHARPDLVEHERQERPERRDRRGRVLKEALWEPNFIGRHYSIKAAAADPQTQQASPRLHWRRGHYRKQPIGSAEQRSVKVIWIEPALIGSRDDAPSPA